MRYILTFIFALTLIVTLAQGKKSKSSLVSIRQADSVFNLRQWKNAITSYEALSKKGSLNAQACSNLGYSYESTGLPDKALTCYQKALLLPHDSSTAAIINFRIARVFASMSESEEAFTALAKSADHGFRNVTQLDTTKAFNILLNDKRFRIYRQQIVDNNYPCLSNAQARQFDFWIGEWNAYVTGTQNLAGYSKIERASGGCMILENWTSAKGVFEGKSINFVDPETNRWKQVWVGSEKNKNVSEFLNGEYRDGAMRFEFEEKDNQGKKVLTHFHFYNESPDQVRQQHQTSTDNGVTWNTTYDFTYVRKK